jgi:hypothetical protein
MLSHDGGLFSSISLRSLLQLKPLAEPIEYLSTVLTVVFGSVTTQTLVRPSATQAVMKRKVAKG